MGTSNTRKRRSRHVQLAMASLRFSDSREGEFMQLSLHKIFWKDVIADFRSYILRQCFIGEIQDSGYKILNINKIYKLRNADMIAQIMSYHT